MARQRVLLITVAVRAAILEAIDRARAEPVPLDVAMALRIADQSKTEVKLSDRRPDAPERPPTQNLLIPDGFEVAFSFEQQPMGLVRHLSVALHDAPGKYPSPEAVAMIAREFGFGALPPKYGKIWLEEVRPDHSAVNVAELCEPPAGAEVVP